MFEKGVAVIGSTTIDENITPAGRWRKIGGVTVYSGITYRRHGVETTVVSNIAGNDREVIAALEKEKIIVCSGHTAHTTHFINREVQNERKQSIPLRSAPIKAFHIERIMKRVSCIHLGPLHPADIDPGAIETVRLAKLPVAVDVQGYTRSVEGKRIATVVSQRLSAVIEIAQIVKSNELELEAILNYLNLDIGDFIKAYNIEECVVTCGKKGGFVQDKKANVHSYKAYQGQSIVDPTGAGDVFLAAYLLGRFLYNRNIAEACSYAADLSARQVSGRYITQQNFGLITGLNS